MLGAWRREHKSRKAQPRFGHSSYRHHHERDDGYLGFGVVDVEDGAEFLAMWRHEGSEPEEAVGSVLES